jgi:predicted MFS family arabinose efflux permease
VIAIVCLTLSFALLPFATPGVFGAIACANYEFVGSFGASLLIITVFSEVPARVPPHTIARVMAAVTLVPEGAALLGSLIGGVLATAWGLRVTFGASLVFSVAANLLLAGLALIARRQSRPQSS